MLSKESLIMVSQLMFRAGQKVSFPPCLFFMISSVHIAIRNASIYTENIISFMKGRSYLAEPFRQITRNLAELFRQITCNLAEP